MVISFSFIATFVLNQRSFNLSYFIIMLNLMKIVASLIHTHTFTRTVTFSFEKWKQTSSPLITENASNVEEDIHSFNMFPSFYYYYTIAKNNIQSHRLNGKMKISSKNT